MVLHKMQEIIEPLAKGRTWEEWKAGLKKRPHGGIATQADIDNWVLRQAGVKAEKEAATVKRKKAA